MLVCVYMYSNYCIHIFGRSISMCTGYISRNTETLKNNFSTQSDDFDEPTYQKNIIAVIVVLPRQSCN